MQKAMVVCVFLVGFMACKETGKKKVDEEQEPQVYKEQYRPQYHFSPPKMWMNDPNGLVYNEGIYHLFYQYYPDDIVWGPMHWGHAVSEDMVHWEHKPIALYPDEHGLIFSGSAVVDRNNASGFAKNGETPLVAIFTYHSMEGEKEGRTDFQTQGIAYSLDNGDTWTKYEGNPVIDNEGIKDFRDPKVFWHESTKRWILALVAGDHAKFYASENLREWEYLSDFGKNQGAHGGVWECPDLFKLPVEGTDEEKWVLIISINPGAPNGGSGTQYFVGDFDGERFTSDQKKAKWLDYGTDNYTGVTYNNIPNGDRIFIGWMSNWDYARDTPTQVWRSAMTLPRKLSLVKMGEEYTLKNFPLEQVDGLTAEMLAKDVRVPSGGKKELVLDGLNQSRIKLRTACKDFSITFKNHLDEALVLSMDSNTNMFRLDRTNSGEVEFQQEFGNKHHQMPLDCSKVGGLELSIFLDRSSVEVFINEGLWVMTDQIFPTAPYTILIISNGQSGQDILLEGIETMQTIW